MIMYEKRSSSRICQGDILENFNYTLTNNEDKAVVCLNLPYVIVLSQNCDLEQDFNQRNASPGSKVENEDKFLQSILICPGYIAEQFRTGEHLKNLGMTMCNWGSNLWRHIKANQNERFHFLQMDTEMGVPNLVIDFKHFYTIPREDIYKIYSSNYLVSIKPLFRESVSQRFSYYLSRIGLPIITAPDEE